MLLSNPVCTQHISSLSSAFSCDDGGLFEMGVSVDQIHMYLLILTNSNLSDTYYVPSSGPMKALSGFWKALELLRHSLPH